ncbi:hypothetical protein [Spiroplasma poulsonii]|uniref:hypothetical protein n=1 Tax=Spiroplasma poulsonii TaxID=2138 RepID=UPI001F4D1075|nr:hypothetical protein [Spiroplasma poulsonii]UNF62642.1 hypothetical protein MNU24_04120 [Spiroplasma poulsonii]
MIILMINYYWCYWKLQSNAQKDKNNLILVKEKHTIKTQVIIEQASPKLLQQAARKHDYALFK